MSEPVALTPQSRSPIGELLALALPTVAQSVSYTAMQFIDTWLLSRLGYEEFTAAANAGMWAFSIICFGFGMLLCVNTLVSQNFGRGDFANCGRYLWQGFWVAIFYSLLVLPLLPLAPRIFPMLGHGARIARLESSYVQIVLAATLFKMIGTAAGQFLLATNRPRSVMISAVLGVSVNALAAYAIVLGNFGFRAHGVVGAAWAQNLGVFVEMSILLALVFTRDARCFNAFDARFRLKEAMTLVRIGLGAGLQIATDIFAWTIFLSFVMAQLGETAMAANQLMFRYMVVSFMPAVGISQAVTALVGRYIGMRRLDVASARADLGFVVAAAYMLVCGAGMVVFRNELVAVFTSDPWVVHDASILMIFAGAYQLFDAMYVVYNGALRGAGDTFVPAIVTSVFCWGIAVGGGYLIAVFVPKLGVAGPWSACTFYGIAIGVFILMRFRRGRWKAIHLERPASEDASNVPAESARLSPA